MNISMKVDSAVIVPVNIFPLIDDTDFKTRETGVAYDAAGMDLVWNFVTPAGVQTQTAVTPTTGGNYDWAHKGDGMYSIEIPASGGTSINNDTEGYGWFSGYATGVLPWRGPIISFLPANVIDSLVNGSDNLDIQVKGMDASVVSASAIASDAITADKIADNAIGADQFTQGAADKVWSSATRTLSSFGTLIADIWGYTTRSLTTFGTLVSDIWANATRSLTDKIDFALTSAYDAAKTASQAGDAMTLTSGQRVKLDASQPDFDVATEANVTAVGNAVVDVHGHVSSMDTRLPVSPAAAGDKMDIVDVPNATGLTAIATAVWGYATRTLSSFGTLVSDIWSAGTRTLTSFGTLAADTATAVWASGTRTLTSFGTLIADIWSNTTRSLTDKAGFTISGTKTTLDVLNDITAQNVWEYATRTLSSFGTLVSDIWAAGTRTLTSFGTLVADISTAVWAAGTRTLTSFGTLVADIWAYSTRTLTSLGTVVADIWAYTTRELTGIGSSGIAADSTVAKAGGIKGTDAIYDLSQDSNDTVGQYIYRWVFGGMALSGDGKTRATAYKTIAEAVAFFNSVPGQRGCIMLVAYESDYSVNVALPDGVDMEGVFTAYPTSYPAPRIGGTYVDYTTPVFSFGKNCKVKNVHFFKSFNLNTISRVVVFNSGCEMRNCKIYSNHGGESGFVLSAMDLGASKGGIIEDNCFEAGPKGQSLIITGALGRHVIVRNNVFMNGTENQIALGDIARQMQFENNTFLGIAAGKYALRLDDMGAHSVVLNSYEGDGDFIQEVDQGHTGPEYAPNAVQNNGDIAGQVDLNLKFPTGTVFVDTASGAAGTTYPLGEAITPVDNVDDAVSIADTNKLRKISIAFGASAAWTTEIAGGSGGYHFIGKVKPSDQKYTLEDDLNNSILELLHFDYTTEPELEFVVGNNRFIKCLISGAWIDVRNNIFDSCLFKASAEISHGLLGTPSAQYLDCHFEKDNVINLAFANTAEVVVISNCSGHLTIKGVKDTQQVLIYGFRGTLTLHSSCTLGAIKVFGGGGVIVDDSVGTVVTITGFLPGTSGLIDVNVDSIANNTDTPLQLETALEGDPEGGDCRIRSNIIEVYNSEANASYLSAACPDLRFLIASEKYAIEYDFTGYSKAVMFFYNADRPFPGDPYAWCYLYTAAGGNPSITSEIAKRDRLKLWSSEQPA